MHLLNDAKYFLQDKPLKTFMNDDDNMYEYVEQVLLLNTGLL